METSSLIRPGGQRGQSTVEWTGLVLLVALLITALASTVTAVPGLGLAHSISTRLLCAVSLDDSCDRPADLVAAYGNEVSALVRARAPQLFFGRDMLGLPVDYRTCRSAWCADGPGEGEVTSSTAGEPVTLFTRVLDCRNGHTGPESVSDCGGERQGSLYFQYWAYYPESASLRGAPVLEEEGYHRNDWESVQVRIGPDGEVSQRASSHNGYNHTKSAANWGSDMGWGFLRRAAEKVGLREEGGWGGVTGEYLIAGGSHAGNVDGQKGYRDYPSFTPASKIRLVPLESVRGQAMSRAARFDPITPPWEKKVWTDPEAEGTG